MLELLVVGSTLTALVLAGSAYRNHDRAASSTAVVDLTAPVPIDPRTDWAAPDLPCPWCGAHTREDDTACPSCGQAFG